MKKIYSTCMIVAVAVATSFAQTSANQVVNFSKSNAGTVATAATTTIGIGEVNQSANVKIYSYENSVFINTTLNYSNSSVEVYNLLGEKIVETSMTNSSTKIAIDSKASSYYIVRVTLDGQSFSKRVYIK